MYHLATTAVGYRSSTIHSEELNHPDFCICNRHEQCVVVT